MKEKYLKCPIEETLNLLNKKWSILIIRDLFFGKKHFNEFKEGKTNLTNKVLSNCLKDLEMKGLIEKKTYQSPLQTEYFLTDYGRSLNKIIYEMAIFTLKNSAEYDCKTKKELTEIFEDIKNNDII